MGLKNSCYSTSPLKNQVLWFLYEYQWVILIMLYFYGNFLMERRIMITNAIFLSALFFSLPIFNNKKTPFVILSFGVLYLFLALRYGYGNDYFSYYNIHSALNEGRSAWGENDFLFRHLNLLIPNFYFMVATISFFYIITIFFLVKSNLTIKRYWFAILLLLINPYLFLNHLSSLRQTIAICFFIYAVHFATKKKLMSYIILVVIASGFHKSSLILLPLYFLFSESRINKKGFIGIGGILIFLFVTPFFETIINRVLYYFPTYNYYVEQGINNSLRSTLITSFFFFLIIFNINKLKGKEIIYGKLSLFSTIISLLSFKISMLSRVQMYFEVFLIIAIPLIFSKFEKKLSRLILFTLLISIYLLRYYSFFDGQYVIGAYRTYKTIYSVP